MIPTKYLQIHAKKLRVHQLSVGIFFRYLVGICMYMKVWWVYFCWSRYFFIGVGICMYLYVSAGICLYLSVCYCHRYFAVSPMYVCVGIPTTNCLIFRLIRLIFLPKSVKSITLSQSRFFRLGDVLRDRPATPEVGTCVPNGCRHGGAPRRHGGAAAICKTRKVRLGREIRRIRLILGGY